MKKLILGTAAAAMLAFTGAANAAELKVGVVNPTRLITEAPQGEAIRNKLEEEFAAERRALMAQQNELKGLQEKFQRDAQVMSESERANMERRIRELGRDFQFQQQTLAEDYRMRQQEEIGKMQQQMQQAIEEFGRAEGYDLILTSVPYYADALDVTDEVLARMKQ